MKRISLWMVCIAMLPGAAFGQSYDERPFDGLKVGASVDRRTLDADYDLPRLNDLVDDERSGVGFRGHLGYDIQIGSALIAGAEAGIGRGGKSLVTDTGVADYRLRPGWNWDASGRIGVLPTPQLMVYGRAGYSWLRARETVDYRDVRRLDETRRGTEKGFLWGAGVEGALTSGLSARAEYNRANYHDGLTSSRVQLGLSLGI